MKLFLPQAQLEEWLLEDKADLRDGTLLVNAETDSYPVQGAVHFVKLVSGEDDQKLLAKVKTDSQLQQLGAEHMSEAVLLGDSAYEVVPGYLTEVPPPVAEAPAAGLKKPAGDTDLLAAFFLNKTKF